MKPLQRVKLPQHATNKMKKVIKQTMAGPKREERVSMILSTHSLVGGPSATGDWIEKSGRAQAPEQSSRPNSMVPKKLRTRSISLTSLSVLPGIARTFAFNPFSASQHYLKSPNVLPEAAGS